MIISSRARRSAICAIRSKPFLRGEAGDDSDDRKFGIGVGDAEGSEKILLVFGFSGKILRRVFRGGELVGLRAPFVVVDAVENARHRRGAVAEDAFEAESVFGGLNFLAVFLADCGDVVGVSQRAFQEIHLAEELHLRHGEEIPREHEQRQSVRREQALVAHVVDGEDRAHFVESRVFGVDGAEQNRNQGRLPVMAMKNMRGAQNFRGFQHGAGEQGKALGVVGIVSGGRTIEGITIEIRRIFDESKNCTPP